MRINPTALERVATSKMSGAGTAEIFKLLAKAAALAPPGAAINFNLGFQQPGDEILPGDLIPVITLSLVPPSEFTPADGRDLPTDRDIASGATGE